MFGVNPKRLRRDLRDRDTADLRRRRGIIGLSLVGLANMALGTLVQTGMLRRLPNLPVKGFDSDKVITSDEAYQFGSPDAAIAVGSFAANMAIAGFGDADRAEKQPLVPVAAAAKAAADVAVSGWYLYRMRCRVETWCAYCLLTGAINVAVLALTIPEALKGARELLRD